MEARRYFATTTISTGETSDTLLGTMVAHVALAP